MSPFDWFIKFVATAGFLGFLPVMPGTFGSCAGLAVFFLVRSVSWGVPAAAAAALAVGFLIAGRAERIFGEKDSRHIVIDEVAGMLIGLLFVPYDFVLCLIGFLMFRIFDTLKPFPAGRLQELKGATGIMLDDIIAGIYTNLVLQAIAYLIRTY